MDINVLNKKTEEINEIVCSFLPESGEYNELITEAAAYSVRAGGKRLRPMMMAEAYELAGGSGAENMLHALMAAMEFIHSFSLVHDDLPAIDNDDLRRGRPTTHRRYGEAIGILAGDALLNLAYSVGAGAAASCDDAETAKRGITALSVIAKKAGIDGMIGGQCLDVLSEKNGNVSIGSSELGYIYKNKTSALIEASLMAGAILAGADRKTVDIFEEIASDVGMAFQIRDDILDVTASDEEMGKPAGSDEKNNKITYVSLYGLEKAAEDVKAYSRKALEKLNTINSGDCFLKELIVYLIERRS